VAPTFGRVGGFLRSIEEEMNNMLQVFTAWLIHNYLYIDNLWLHAMHTCRLCTEYDAQLSIS
jgi:hypothetical protein